MTSEDFNTPANKASISHRKPVFGIGINDADYVVFPTVSGKQVMCPYYRAWANMLSRCYSSKSQCSQPTYIGCSVCDEWLTFSSFKRWMLEQDWQGKALDKDLLVSGNKIYSPETCLFVSQKINNLLIDRAAARGSCPQGVSFHKIKRRYIAKLSINGRLKQIGCYDTPAEASHAYKKAKSAHIREIAYNQKDKRLQAALLIASEKIADIKPS